MKCPRCNSSRLRFNFKNLDGDIIKVACQRCHYVNSENMGKHTINKSMKTRAFANGITLSVGDRVKIDIDGTDYGMGTIISFRNDPEQDIVQIRRDGVMSTRNINYSFLSPIGNPKDTSSESEQDVPHESLNGVHDAEKLPSENSGDEQSG